MVVVKEDSKSINIMLTSRLNKRHNTICAGLGYAIADAIAYLGDFKEANAILGIDENNNEIYIGKSVDGTFDIYDNLPPSPDEPMPDQVVVTATAVDSSKNQYKLVELYLLHVDDFENPMERLVYCKALVNIFKPALKYLGIVWRLAIQ